MKVKDLIEFLITQDQDADVFVVENSSTSGYYSQGGIAEEVLFNHEVHFEYTDFRGNQFVEPDSDHFNTRHILLGNADS
jgi:hypothetical protein